MYAVVTTGGKQYRVEAGSELTIERLAADAGASVTFDRVLLVGDGETVTVGTPIVDGAIVNATVLGEALGPKLVIFKFKQKVKYRRTTGHRQHLTRVRIDEISAAGKSAKAEPTAKGTAPEAEAPTKPRRTRAATTAKATTAKTATAKATTTKAPATKRTPARRATAKPEASGAEVTGEAAPEAGAAKPKRTRKPAASKAKARPEPEAEE
jgi:large subunit ribosomal protein L21